MATKKQIKALNTALIKSKERSDAFREEDDYGTCNFDTPQLFLTGWSAEDVRLAFDQTGMRYEVQSVGNRLCVDIYGCASGQASRRTKMAEAIRDSLKEAGYDAYVYYQMD